MSNLRARRIPTVFVDQLLAAAGHEAISFREYEGEVQEFPVAQHMPKTNQWTLFPKLMVLVNRHDNRAYMLRNETGVWYLRSTDKGKWHPMTHAWPRSVHVEEVYRSYLDGVILNTERDPTGAHARQP